MNTASPSSTPEAADPIRIMDHSAAIAVATRIIQEARQKLVIRSLDLEAWLYDHPDILLALRTMVTTGRNPQVCVLLHDAAAPQAAHAKLLDLAQRLPSKFQFREVDDPVYREDRAALIANEAGGYYFRPVGDRVEGTAGVNSRARVRQLHARFDEIWERSQPISAYRALGI